MPWCPVCKNEYVEGKTHCPDCDVDLVEKLVEEKEESAFAHKISMLTEEEQIEMAEIAARRAAAAHMNTYVSAKSRLAETKSSAWAFLAIGAIGSGIMLLAFIGVLELPFHTFAMVIMEVMFAGFLIVAAMSFKNMNKMMSEVSSEEDLAERIKVWAKDTLKVDELVSDLDADTTEEMKYFMVSEVIREKLMVAFPEVDDAYAEELTENFYNELFS
ncbi:MAG: hypothetical protein IKV59_01450 [Lachnospiraceae bacterium]|nr:hypothetical protein [Lachnospiraceae bacterium]